LKGLALTVVGGLNYRGYTEHDIDVIGKETDVPVLVKRLSAKGIKNLVHYCGPEFGEHSHWQALKNGFLVTFFGNKISFPFSVRDSKVRLDRGEKYSDIFESLAYSGENCPL